MAENAATNHANVMRPKNFVDKHLSSTVQKMERTFDVDEAFEADETSAQLITDAAKQKKSPTRHPTKAPVKTKSPTGSPTACPTTDISFHGGPVMTGAIHIYTMWWGTSANEYATGGDGASTHSLVNTFVQNMGGSKIFNTATSYYSASNVKLSNSVAFKVDAIMSDTTSLSDTIIQNKILALINAGTFALDTNAIYTNFFQGSIPYTSDIQGLGGFASSWCGYHSSFTVNSGGTSYLLKYSVIGDSNYSPSDLNGYTALQSCTAFPTGSINGNAGADGTFTICVDSSCISICSLFHLLTYLIISIL